MIKKQTPPGQVQTFVRSVGFGEQFGRTMLIDENGNGRVFLELKRDPDRLHDDPDTAYARLLAGLRPGGEFRIMQVYWPDRIPRAQFLDQVNSWDPGPSAPVTNLSRQLQFFLESAPLPFHRRTLLEMVIQVESDLEWAMGSMEIFSRYGIQASWLDNEAVHYLLQWFFNPEF